MICWTPFFIINNASAVCISVPGLNCEIPDLIFRVFVWLGYLNSMLNPIIYFIGSEEYRKAFQKLFNNSTLPRTRK